MDSRNWHLPNFVLFSLIFLQGTFAFAVGAGGVVTTNIQPTTTTTTTQPQTTDAAAQAAAEKEKKCNASVSAAATACEIPIPKIPHANGQTPKEGMFKCAKEAHSIESYLAREIKSCDSALAQCTQDCAMVAVAKCIPPRKNRDNAERVQKLAKRTEKQCRDSARALCNKDQGTLQSDEQCQKQGQEDQANEFADAAKVPSSEPEGVGGVVARANEKGEVSYYTDCSGSNPPASCTVDDYTASENPTQEKSAGYDPTYDAYYVSEDASAAADRYAYNQIVNDGATPEGPTTVTEVDPFDKEPIYAFSGGVPTDVPGTTLTHVDIEPESSPRGITPTDEPAPAPSATAPAEPAPTTVKEDPSGGTSPTKAASTPQNQGGQQPQQQQQQQQQQGQGGVGGMGGLGGGGAGGGAAGGAGMQANIGGASNAGEAPKLPQYDKGSAYDGLKKDIKSVDAAKDFKMKSELQVARGAATNNKNVPKGTKAPSYRQGQTYQDSGGGNLFGGNGSGDRSGKKKKKDEEDNGEPDYKKYTKSQGFFGSLASAMGLGTFFGLDKDEDKAGAKVAAAKKGQRGPASEDDPKNMLNQSWRKVLGGNGHDRGVASLGTTPRHVFIFNSVCDTYGEFQRDNHLIADGGYIACPSSK